MKLWYGLELECGFRVRVSMRVYGLCFHVSEDEGESG